MDKKKQDLFLLSADNKSVFLNYKKTVETPIKIQKFKITLSKKIKSTKKVSMWGLIPTKENKKIWKDLKADDIALFFRNGRFFSSAKIIGTAQNERIPGLVWKGDQFGKSRSLLIFLTDLNSTDLALKSAMPSLVEPTMPDVYTFPIKKIDISKRNILISTFGSLTNAISYLSNKIDDQSSDIVETEKIPHNVKVELMSTISKRRKGQEKFRKNVLKNYDYRCPVCDISDEELLEASHIIPVSEVSVAGLTKNGICFCALHHTMFDKGYFSFDDNYKIVLSNKKNMSTKVRQSITEGKKISHVKIYPSKEFLKLHRTRFEI